MLCHSALPYLVRFAQVEAKSSRAEGRAGWGGSYFSPPWIWLLALKFDHAGMREPGNSLARDEDAWRTLYDMTLRIVNDKLAEKGLDKIAAAGPPR